MKRIDLGTIPPLGEIPEKMLACTIRKEREGEPAQAMRIEEVDLPDIDPTEVLVLVMAAGINYNGIWLAQGKPVSAFRFHQHPYHIAGSDASGIVWRVGAMVHRWKVGDEVVIHCNQACGECPECNGFDPMACSEQKIWGYETSFGAFAQFTKVQSQQLLRRPQHLTWEQSASYGLTYFTAYRMLISQAEMKAGHLVLVWGAAGGLGIFALQLCNLVGADVIAVVSSAEKAAMVHKMGAKFVLNRQGFELMPYSTNQEPRRLQEIKRFGKEVRHLTGGRDPDIVFEHVGKETFATSVFVAKRFGKIVICGATTGYDLDFDARYLWMRQKTIIGSHFANAYQATAANELLLQQKIYPVLDHVFAFEDIPLAHQIMRENRHKGKMAARVQAPPAPAQRSLD
jgi:crotonyl-CoA carboxylase/reductase